MKKISLLGANFDTGNMGVGALTMGAISCVKYAWPDAEISLLEYDDRSKTIACKFHESIIPIRLVALRFSKKFYLPNNIAFLILISVLLRLPIPKKIKIGLIKRNISLQHLYDADLVLSLAGGDSFSDIYGLGRFYYIVLPLLWAIVMKKELVIMPQTIGPFSKAIPSRIAAFILKNSKIVFARDMESLSLAQGMMGSKFAHKARFSYDLGFLLEPIRPDLPIPKLSDKILPDRMKRPRPVVGLNISGLLCMGGYNGKNMFALKTDYSELMRALIQFLIEEKHADVLLVPHVFGNSLESDVSASAKIFEELKVRFGTHLLLAQGDYDQNGIKYVIGQCDFFIGSRMHACIAALSLGIPAIGIAYSRKFAGVLGSIDMEELIADPRKNTMAEMLTIIGTTMDSRAEKAHALEKKMLFLKPTVLKILEYIQLQ